MFTRAKQVIIHFQTSIVGGAVLLGVASLSSRVLGLLRDKLLAATFGVGPVLDSYFTAFKIPDFLFNILVLGVISASFVPLYVELREKSGNDAAIRMANGILNIVVFGLIGLSIIGVLLAPELAGLLAPTETLEQRLQTAEFMRYMFVALIFFGISNVMSGILHANRRFFVYALAPLLYNIGIIFGIVVLVPVLGVIGLPLGVVIGAAAHAVIQIPEARRLGFRYELIFGWSFEPVRRAIMQAPPRAIALGLTQVNTIILFAVASTLGTGSRSVFQFADNLQHFPINIFGVSLALAVFPVFSEALATRDMQKFRQVFSESFRRILFFIIPISIATLLLRSQIVRIVYGAGQFDWDATIAVAQLLGVFTLSMFAQAVIPLLTRSYFAKQDVITPVLISFVTVGTNTALAFWAAPQWGIYGIGAAYSFAMMLQMLLLLAGLRIRFGDLDDAQIASSVYKIITASFAMGVIIQGLKYAIAPVVDMQTWLGIFTQTMLALVGGGLVYIVIARSFHFAEAEQIYGKFTGAAQFFYQTVRRVSGFPVKPKSK